MQTIEAPPEANDTDDVRGQPGDYTPSDVVLIEKNSIVSRYNMLEGAYRETRAAIAVASDVEPDSEIGSICYETFNLDLLRARNRSYVDAFDEVSQSAYELGELMFTGKFEVLTKRFVSIYGDSRPSEILFIQSLYLEPEWRGRKFGLEALALVLREHYRRGVFPVLFASPLSPSDFTAAQLQAARTQLARYYGVLGFERVGRTGFMGLNLEQFPHEYLK